MIIEPRKQQNLVPIITVLLMIVTLMYLPSVSKGIDNIETVGGGHSNHTDTQSTVLPGNTCPNGCPWPDCGCNGPVLTLQPTVYISPFPTFNPMSTPVIPGPANNNATVFPTLALDLIPTGLPTPRPTHMIWPTEVAPPIPTIERSIRDVDRPDGTGGGLD